jgi:hypothetical protein
MREGLLADIEAGLLDEATSITLLLQKCVVLGGHAGSDKLRNLARRELLGYAQVADLPDYRKVPAQLRARITNAYGYQSMEQTLTPAELPNSVREALSCDTASIGSSIGELEAMLSQADGMVSIRPGGHGDLVDYLNSLNESDSRVELVYWAVSSVTIAGLLSRIRTALAELLGEIIAAMPSDQTIPDKAAADQAVQIVVTGSRNRVVNYAAQSGIGRVGGLQVGALETSPQESWWQRWRKRGLIIGLSTFVAAVVGVFTWLDWTPW